eukprot:UN03980
MQFGNNSQNPEGDTEDGNDDGLGIVGGGGRRGRNNNNPDGNDGQNAVLLAKQMQSNQLLFAELQQFYYINQHKFDPHHASYYQQHDALNTCNPFDTIFTALYSKKLNLNSKTDINGKLIKTKYK